MRDGERIGLIGRNGRGKSSLLAIIAGRAQLDGGQLPRRDGLRVFYRLAKENNTDLKALHQFLRKVLKGKSMLEDDLKELKDAMARGACAKPTTTRIGQPVASDVASTRTPLATS